MKKLAAGFIGLCFLFCALVCSATYLIHLKDGREISTQEYWEEDGQIKIKQYGGVVGINKEEVVSVEEIEQPKTIVVKPPSEKKPVAKDEPETNEGQETKKGASEKVNEEKKPEEPAAEKKEKEKNAFLKEFDSLKKRFEKVESMTKEELFQFDKDLLGLRNKILQAGLGGVYADQIVELMEMNHKAEEIYKQKKKKNQ